MVTVVFQVHKGVDAQGQDMTNIECDTVDEIEALIDRFDCEDMVSSRESKQEAKAERAFEDLYKVGEISIELEACTVTVLVLIGTGLLDACMYTCI